MNTNSEEEDWKFTQWFRKTDKELAKTEADFVYGVSALRFNASGEFLATGDNSGQIVVLKNNPELAKSRGESVRYGFYTEIDAHPPEYDYISSFNIPEAVADLEWGPSTQDSIYLLSANAKHIKLFKIGEKKPVSRVVNYNNLDADTSALLSLRYSQFEPSQLTERKKSMDEMRMQLKVPKIIRDPLQVIYWLKKHYKPYNDAYANNPNHHLASTADKENFMSAACYTVNLWNFEVEKECQEIVTLPFGMKTKPENRDEIITSLECHPLYSHLFMYGTTMGNLSLCDLRQKSVANSASKLFKGVPMNQKEKDQQSFLDEVTSGITAAKFSNGGRFLVTRDYMTVKIWDVQYEKKPLETFYVHEYLRENLFELHRNKIVWDHFGLDINPNGDIVTGSYSNFFQLYELQERRSVFVQASQGPQSITPLKQHTKRRKVDPSKIKVKSNNKNKETGGFGIRNLFGRKKKDAPRDFHVPSEVTETPIDLDFEAIDFQKRISLCAYHPTENAVVVTGQSSVFVYTKKK